MAIVFSGTPLTGTAGNDYVIDYGGNANADNTLDGLAGNDVLMADWDWFESSAGSSVGGAANITSNTQPWSTAENADINNSTTVPHSSVVFSATSVGQAYYKVSVIAGQTITLDVDYTFTGTDTLVQIYDATGTTLLATNDDGGVNDVGSPRGLDSFLQYTFLQSGNFIVRVMEFGGDGNFEVGDGYIMHVSLTGQTVTNSQPIFGNDTLIGGAGIDYLSGGGGDDTFVIKSVSDVVAGEYYNGGAGMDTILGDTAGSYAIDFTGTQIYSIEKVKMDDAGANGTATFLFLAAQFGAGISLTATIEGSGFSDVVDTLDITMGSVSTLDLSGLTITGFSLSDVIIIHGDSSAETITGTTWNDNISGAAGADTLNGGSGNDILDGGDDSDTLNGGTGSDTLNGGAGDDTYILGDDTTDTIVESTGTDTITSTVTRSLAGYSMVENLELKGSAHINGTGNDLANVITGNSGNNILSGGLGADTLKGGAGNDTYVLGSAKDDIIVDTSGVDTITSTITRSLAGFAAIENLTLTGSAHINGTGNDLANVITGNSGNNILSGGAGADTLKGGAGNDTYVLGAAKNDKIIDTSGSDTITSTITRSLGGFTTIEKLTLQGSGHINGTGNNLSNVITGNAGNNILNGGVGNDKIYGGTGNDKIYGGTGKDLLIGGSGSDVFVFDTKLGSTNIDTIDDFSVKDDTIWLDSDIFTKAGKVGDLASAAFYIGSKAHDSSDRIIYDKSNGKLWYDADGSGKGAAVQFALLDKGLSITTSDFDIIA